MSHLFITFALFVSSFLVPLSVFAHGGTPSFEKEVGPLLIDVGYDRVGIRPNEEVTFDFDLFRTGESPTFEPFDLVRIEVHKGTELVLSQEVENVEQNVPTTKITFPEAGTYTLAVGYVREGSLVADASFEVPVGETNGWVGRISEGATYVIAGALTVFAVFYIVYSFRNRRAVSGRSEETRNKEMDQAENHQ